MFYGLLLITLLLFLQIQNEGYLMYRTIIDSLGIRIECSSPYEQREILSKLLEYAGDSNLSYFVNYIDHVINSMTGAINREYFIYSHSKTLASITTMSYQAGKKRGKTVYYVKVIWAGIKSYNEFTDNMSLICMLSMTSWLRANKIDFRLSELDLGIDVERYFEHVSVLPVKRVPNVKYYNPDDVQKYVGQTAWIEKINIKRKDHVASRAYTYDKQHKEDLKDEVTRFELKLQTGFFNNSKLDNFYSVVLAIYNALDRYAVLYFEDINVKHYIEQQYMDIVGSDIKNKSRKIKGLELDPYRLYPDTKFIEQFLSTVLYTKDFHTNMGEEWFVDSTLEKLNN